MSDILLRTPRPLPLEYEDVDANFENLNADKLQRTTNAGVTGTITTSATTSTITGLSSNNLAIGMRLVKTAGTGVLGTASTITAVDQLNDTVTVAASSSHTSGSITFTAAPVLDGAYIEGATIGGTTPGVGTFSTLSASSYSGNLTFSGTGSRILGDFTNTTVANRVMFQTTTSNSATSINAIPSGTQTASNIRAVNASDPTNAAFTAISITSSASSITAGIYGTGTYLPLTFSTNGSEQMRLDTSGNLGIGNTPSGTYKFEVTGNGYFSTALTVNTDLTVNGNTTLGNASGDTLTFQASTVSTPNGLNFDSNTLVIDHTNNRVGIGNASPGYPLDVTGVVNIAPSNISGTQTGLRLFDAGTGSGEGLDILWESTNRTSMCIINAIGDTTGGKLRFLTNGAASGNSALAAEIDENGYMYNYAGVANVRNSKSIVPGYQYFRLNSNVVGSNSTGAQTMFGVGCSLAANTVYEFEISVNFRKSAGTNNHSFQLGFGGTRGVNNILYNVWAGTIQTTLNSVDTGAPTASVDTVNLTTVTDQVGIATVASVGMLIKGTISVSTAGTFIPQYGLTTVAPGGAYSTIAGSYIKITPIGASGANTSIGSWA